MSKRKPILCLDFDGVIHSYDSGWKGADVIPDPPVKGARSFIHSALDRFDVQVFSSRSRRPGGREAMQKWLSDHMLDFTEGDYDHAATILAKIGWPDEKPPALVTIDDRAITFTGEWPTLDDLEGFKPWNRK